MKTVEMAEATAPLAEYARDVDEEPVIVAIDGKPVAALIPIRNADWQATTVTVNADSKLLAFLQAMRRRQADGEGVSREEEMRRRLRLCLATCELE